MMTMDVSAIRAVMLVGGSTHEIVPGKIEMVGAVIAGEAQPAIRFTDAKTHQRWTVPRSQVIGFDGDLVEPPDPAVEWRRLSDARLAAGIATRQVRGGSVSYFDPAHMDPDRRAALGAALGGAIDEVTGGVNRNLAQGAWSLLVDRIEIPELGQQRPDEPALEFLNRRRARPASDTAETVRAQLAEVMAIVAMKDLVARRPAAVPADSDG